MHAIGHLSSNWCIIIVTMVDNWHFPQLTSQARISAHQPLQFHRSTLSPSTPAKSSWPVGFSQRLSVVWHHVSPVNGLQWMLLGVVCGECSRRGVIDAAKMRICNPHLVQIQLTGGRCQPTVFRRRLVPSIRVHPQTNTFHTGQRNKPATWTYVM